MAPVEVGELLSLKASVNFTGNTSIVVGLRVESENIQTGAIKHCNSSYFTMVAKDDQGNNVKVPGLILDSEEAVRRFSRSMRRQQESQSRAAAFHSTEFDLKEHLAELEGQNMQLDIEI